MQCIREVRLFVLNCDVTAEELYERSAHIQLAYMRSMEISLVVSPHPKHSIVQRVDILRPSQVLGHLHFGSIRQNLKDRICILSANQHSL